MNSLAALNKLIEELSKSSAVKELIDKEFPIHMFKVEHDEYIKLAQELRSYGRTDLIDYVFDNSGTYTTGKLANSSVIRELIETYRVDHSVSTDQELQSVYSRLIAIVNALEANEAKVGQKFGLSKESVSKLLANTEAIRDITYAVDINTTSEIKTISARFISDISGRLFGNKDLLGIYSTNLEGKIADKIYKEAAKKFSSIDTSGLINNFTNAVLEEFQGKLSSNRVINEFQHSVTEKLKLTTDKISKAINLIESGTQSLSTEISKVKRKRKTRNVGDSAVPGLIDIINQGLEQALKARMKSPALVWGGGYGKSYGTLKSFPTEQKGRFARNVKVTDISYSKTAQEKISIAKFRFLRQFYGTFLHGGAKWTPSRDVENLVRLAITDLVKTKVTNKFKAIAT